MHQLWQNVQAGENLRRLVKALQQWCASSRIYPLVILQQLVPLRFPPRQPYMSQCHGQLEFWATAPLTRMNCLSKWVLLDSWRIKSQGCQTDLSCGNPSAHVSLQFSNVERAGFSNPRDETCSQSSCQEAISQHGKQNSPACHRHSRFDGLTVFYMSLVQEWSITAWTTFVCFKHSWLFKLLLINMSLVRCCSNTNITNLRGKRLHLRYQW